MLRRLFTTRASRLKRLEAFSQSDLSQHSSALRDEIRWWNWNWHNGSRSSHLHDLAQLRRILALLRAGKSLDTTPAELVCDRLAVFFQCDTNYRIDGRSLIPQAATEWVTLDGQLQATLRPLRA
jgi:hypothetical protein